MASYDALRQFALTEICVIACRALTPIFVILLAGCGGRRGQGGADQLERVFGAVIFVGGIIFILFLIGSIVDKNAKGISGTIKAGMGASMVLLLIICFAILVLKLLF
jgi:hypothetical protein